MISKNVERIVSNIDRRKLKNNVQRTLFALLTSKDEWVSRSAIRVNSAASRLRDLRKEEFGGFVVDCATATQLGRKTAKNAARKTFYRLRDSSVTLSRVTKVFEGVIATSK